MLSLSFALTLVPGCTEFSVAPLDPAGSSPEGARSALANTPTAVPYDDVDASNTAGWWSPLAARGGSIFCAYSASDPAPLFHPAEGGDRHVIRVAEQRADGSWRRYVAIDPGEEPSTFVNDPGHRQPSLAVDGSGRLHVFGSMHQDGWRYYRAQSYYGVLINHSTEMPDQGGKYTYPIVRTAPNGDLYLVIRKWEGIGLTSRGEGKLYRWDNQTGRWSAVGVFARSNRKGVYPDDIQIDNDGGVHLLFEWAAMTSAFRHKLSYIKYTPATAAWTNRRGTVLKVPVSVTEGPVATEGADVIQDVVDGEEWKDGSVVYKGPAVQSAKMHVDGGVVRVVYRHRAVKEGPFLVKSAWSSATSWSGDTVYSGGPTLAALGIVWDGLEKRVYYLLASKAMQRARKTSSGYSVRGVFTDQLISSFSVTRDDGQDVVYGMSPSPRPTILLGFEH